MIAALKVMKKFALREAQSLIWKCNSHMMMQLLMSSLSASASPMVRCHLISLSDREAIYLQVLTS